VSIDDFVETIEQIDGNIVLHLHRAVSLLALPTLRSRSLEEFADRDLKLHGDGLAKARQAFASVDIGNRVNGPAD
jgi:hypothetical protein